MVTVSTRIALIRKVITHLIGTLRQERTVQPLLLVGNRSAHELISRASQWSAEQVTGQTSQRCEHQPSSRVL